MALAMQIFIALILALPVDGIALVAGVDRIFDMERTTVSITGDAACTVVAASKRSAAKTKK